MPVPNATLQFYHMEKTGRCDAELTQSGWYFAGQAVYIRRCVHAQWAL